MPANFETALYPVDTISVTGHKNFDLCRPASIIKVTAPVLGEEQHKRTVTLSLFCEKRNIASIFSSTGYMLEQCPYYRKLSSEAG